MGENNSKILSYQTRESQNLQGVKWQQYPRREQPQQQAHLKIEQLQEAQYPKKDEQPKQQGHLKTQQLQQEISVKAYLFSNENKSSVWDEAIETRRFLLTAKELSNYTDFRYTLAGKFPILGMVPWNSYKIFWRDNEGDNIIISSDEELAHAMRFAEKDGLKIYIKLNHDTIPKPPVVNNATEQPKEKGGWQKGATATYSTHPKINASKREQPVKYKVSMKDLLESISALSVDKKDASAADYKLKDSKENSQELLNDEKLVELKKLIKKKIEEKKLHSPFEDQLQDRDNPLHHHHSQANAGARMSNFPPPQHHFHQQGFKRGKPRGRGRFQHRGGHHHAQRQEKHQEQKTPEKQEHEPYNARRENRQESFHHPLQRQCSQEQMQPVELKKLIEIKEKKTDFLFEDQLRDHDNAIHHYPSLQANEGTWSGNFPPQHRLGRNPRSHKRFQNREGNHQAQRQEVYHQDQMRLEKQEENAHEPNNARRESRQGSRQYSWEQNLHKANSAAMQNKQNQLYKNN